MEQINIITIDSASAELKVAISFNDKNKTFDMNDGFNHLENIIPLLDEGLNELGMKKSDLTSLVVSCGPGSFTGIRIGIATMQALSYALKLPLTGINGLDIYSFLLKDDSDSVIIPLVDAKKKRFYCSFLNTTDKNMYDYTPQEILEKIKSFYLDKKIIFTGKDFGITKAFFDDSGVSYSWKYHDGYKASDLLDYSIHCVKSGVTTVAEPIYLRQSEAEIALLEKKGLSS